MDGDEKRGAKRRSLEAGREMLARYKASHGNSEVSQAESSDVDESRLHHRETVNPSLDLHNSSMLDDTSCIDTTQSSMSVSEGEGDGDIEGMAGHIAELKELVQSKEAVIESLSTEIDHMRADACSPNSSQSHNSSTPYRDILHVYQTKLQDFEAAISQRDQLIQDLSSSLEQTLQARNALKTQLQAINAIPILNPSSARTEYPLEAQEQIKQLQQSLNYHLELVKRLEIEKQQQNDEISEYKVRTNQLNEKIQAREAQISANIEDTLKTQKEYETQVEKITKDMQVIFEKFKDETESKTVKHQQEVKDLEMKHKNEISQMKQQQEEKYKVIFERYNRELPELETKHAKELSVFQSQLSSYKKTIEVLKLELDNQSDKSEVSSLKSLLLNSQQEKEMLHEQIKLHKIQVEEMTAKYIAAASVFDSKESIERSLEEALTNVASLKQENETLKFKYDDLSARHSAAQALIENNQLHLEKSMNRLSGINNASYMSEFNATTYQTFDDMAMQFQMAKSKLDEKESVEKKLFDRIKILEETVIKANKQLEEANMEKKSYEKQLKDMKNSCDKIRSDLQNSSNIDKKSNESGMNQNSVSNEVSYKLDSLSKEIEELKQTLKKKDVEIFQKDHQLNDVLDKMKSYQSKCDQLKNGLTMAWKQCAEQEEKLNQSLAVNESRLTESYAMTTLNCTLNNNELVDVPCNDTKITLDDTDVPFNLDDTEKNIRYEQIELENQRLLDENSGLLKTSQNLEFLKKSLDEINREKSQLINEIADLREKHKEEIVKLKLDFETEIGKMHSLLSGSGIEEFKEELEKKHGKEMEKLRTYFEQKCVEMEKQYSDEIFSVQSKKMSDSSETDDATDDLYFGGGEDSIDIFKGKKKSNYHPEENNIKFIDQHCQTELDDAVVNGELTELTELRAAYSLQLEEQVELARQDIVNALQEQIQVLLAVESDTEENWPPELLQLRNKFTSNAKRELEKLKEVHASEIFEINEEHSKMLTRTIERYEEKMKQFIGENKRTNEEEHDLDVEVLPRNYENLHKTCVTLKGLVVDLVKYLITCEEELNNTLIGEIIKRQALSETQTTSDLDQEIGEKEEIENLSSIPPNMKIKRVHFAPQTNRISSIVNSETGILLELIDEEEDISAKLRGELDKCLTRMRADSAQIVNLSLQPGETMIDTLSKQILWTTKVNDELSAKLEEAESHLEEYQAELKQLKMKIMNLQQKLIAIDEKKEIISEGYGEQDDTGNEIVEEDLSQLKEKARSVVLSGTGDNNYLLQLIEELCRYNEKLIEDFRKEKEDLQQQIDAADKQLRSTRKFLEEQANEREVERDEAVRQIRSLQEQLKERERDRERDSRITSEPSSPSLDSSSSVVTLTPQTIEIQEAVEALESQMREMSSLMSDTEAKKSEAEGELKIAVEKIWVLRDIIVDLEQQIQAKNNNEESLVSQVQQLREVVKTQSQTQRELAEELEIVRSGGDSQMNDHLTHLQDELRKHKLSTEHFNVNSTALKQMKCELREMQNHLDKRIKELEALHMCGSNLSISQPSEDVSIRDQIDASRCETPDDDPNAPPTLPLDQILKFKEKLLKHSRTEEVAFKKVKDLEMQLSALKIQNEELLAEQEILQQNNSDQLFQIEQMRGRLEQYKHSAPFAQRQATSKLELELHELNAKLQSMEQTIANKDLEVKNLQLNLKRVNQLLMERQQELASAVQNENDLIQELRNRLGVVEHEKRSMEAQLNAQHDLPQLIHSMLADKNEEIDHLKEQLFKKEKQVEALIDDNNVKQQTPKNSARTLSDIVSINSECEEICEAVRETPNVNRNFSHNMSSIRVQNTPQTNHRGKETFDGSGAMLIDLQKSELRIPTLELGDSQSPNQTKQESIRSEFNLMSPPSINTIQSDVTDHVKSPENERSESRERISSPNVEKDQSTNSGSTKLAVEELENRLKTIYEELKAKSTILNKREAELESLKKSLDELHTESKYTIENLTQDKVFFQNQYELSQETENKIREDLEDVENHLKITTEELESYRGKIQMNERILMEIQTENKNLKQEILKLRETNSSYESTIRERATELNNLRELIFEKDITIETVQTRNVEIENENKQLYEFKTKFEVCRKDLIDCQNEIKRLSDGINNRDEMIKRLEDIARRSSSGVFNSSSIDDNKDQEIHHLKEYLKEKEKIIRQMSEDSKSLHRSLETIQNKMKESGNVVELRKKLNHERKCNGEMAKMIGKLTNELEELKEDAMRQTTEANDIEDMVQRELNLSADLDKKIMDAIESETEEISFRHMHSDSANTRPVEKDLEKIMDQYMEIQNQLRRQNMKNEELIRQKNELEIQREMLKTQVSEYENRILQIKTDFENECKKNVSLSDEVSSKKAIIRNLEIQMRKEKSALQKIQLQDSELINMLRIKCTSSLTAEEDMRNSLTTLRQKYKTVTTQLAAMKTQIQSNRIGQVQIPPHLPEAEQSEILLAEKYEKEHRLNLELQETTKKLENQKKHCEKELDIAMEENEQLLSRLALTEDLKGHLEIDLKRTKEDIKSREEECEWLQKRIKTMVDADKKRQQQSLDKQGENTNLRKEIDNMRGVMDDLQEDFDECRRQLSLSLSEQSQLTQVVTDLRKTESELKTKLNNATNEEERLKEIISELESKLRASVRFESESPKDTSENERILSSSQYRQNIMDLNNEIDRYSHEKVILFDKLKEARAENVKFGEQIRELEEIIRTRRYENSEIISKLQHIHVKYIRADSKRKALAYQKRYLLCVIGGYQLSEETTLSVLAQLTNAQKSFTIADNNRRTPKVRFRSLVRAIISIQRMKWKVQRWKTTIKRCGSEIVRNKSVHNFLPIRQQHHNDNSQIVREDRGLNFEHFLQRVLNIQETLGLATGESASRDQVQ